MLEGIQNVLNVTEFRKRAVFTLIMFVIFRLGVHIPVPGVDSTVIENLFSSGNLFGLLDLFSGGALSKFSVLAMSITPYINASIIMQLLTSVVPKFEQWAKDNQDGREKIQKVTRYGTVLLGLIQAFAMSYALKVNNALVSNSWTMVIMVALILTAGTCFLMWLGDQITAGGIGNGISLIIFAGIVARFPNGVQTMYQYVQAGTVNVFQALLFALIALLMIVVVIEVTQGQRRVSVQYAKRVVGRKMYGGHTTHIPLKVNQAGVIPIIFASSVLMFPITVAQFVQNETIRAVAAFFAWGTMANTICYAFLIIFFTYFYTAISLNIPQLTENMQKYGGFIPGIRPGQPTAKHIDRIMTRITLAGAFFLAFVAILPNFIGWITGIQGVYFGGTAVLIVVGVAIDTMKQAESLVLNKQYQGFMK
ncbi:MULTISPECIES: preprotein translocase subunit SecY [Megasphaera]|uniref:Protein translocase subunit SecY n=1 Tax=Megasphaera vaginalis (ex Srinivasan et al. 2021) TaxID=1111454 RepID=U7UMA4_9FIRM|nr:MULTISPECIES: preprotein translocase subunit SecY [Megasphaera]ERT60547.1 preprotein translocase, SecY subunit [Megasphaera vaginalis (ex Srinivasan et al. 2021)]